jgi:hypothetical protein
VDVSRNLNIFCDYLLAPDTQSIEIKSPVFCVVEAKNRSIEEGYAQAGAEIIVARIFNEKAQKPTPIVFGCVTNAFDWNFLRLKNDCLYIENRRYYMEGNDNLTELLNKLYQILETYI